MVGCVSDCSFKHGFSELNCFLVVTVSLRIISFCYFLWLQILSLDNSLLLKVSPSPLLLPAQLLAGSCGVQAPLPSSGSRAAGTLQHVSPPLRHQRSWLYWKEENAPALQSRLKCLNRFWVSVLEFGRLTGCLWNVTGFQLQVVFSGLSTGSHFLI